VTVSTHTANFYSQPLRKNPVFVVFTKEHTTMSTPTLSWLFETKALKISPASSPFWYTSGLIGPYYINTHFLCGGEEKANEILAFIDKESNNISAFPTKLLEKLTEVYNNFPIFKDCIDALVVEAKNIPNGLCDAISGGERRDWFFAPLVAQKLNKPIYYIYKSLEIYDENGITVNDLNGKNVVNIADLLTVAHSFTRMWAPALAAKGGKLSWAMAVVDRMQGGKENIMGTGASGVSTLFSIDQSLFDEALKLKYIDQGQYDLVSNYLTDPFIAMQNFLKTTPEFLENAKNSPDAKTRGRVEKLLGEDLYKLNS